MPVHDYKTSDVIAGNIPKGADLVESLAKICSERGVTAGLISLIGSVSEAAISYYHQDVKSYESIEPVKLPMEIVSASGNVSMKDGKPHVHLHAVLSASSGMCVAGHVDSGTKVFACEFSIIKLEGPELSRKRDDDTGLFLWRD